MKYATAVLCSVLLFIGCETRKSFQCNCDTSYLSFNDSLVDDFFADSVFLRRQHDYYDLEHLSNLNTESYRLRMYHSFASHTQFYTLSKTNSGAKLEVRQYSHEGEPAKHLDEKYLIDLTEIEWKSIKDEIDSSCYWANKQGINKCRTCLDGGTWLLEGYDPLKRNCAERKQNIDACDYGSDSKLGKLCTAIRKYAEEDRLIVYPYK